MAIVPAQTKQNVQDNEDFGNCTNHMQNEDLKQRIPNHHAQCFEVLQYPNIVKGQSVTSL
eukprot:3299294-Amphidinium_carterae.1